MKFEHHPSDLAPVCNVTIPVFNRPDTTVATILALRSTSQEVPFDITVVDNGSDAHLVNKLRDLHAKQIIDHLFLLPRNMGVACAANIGWELVPAPLYMKLDNDTAMMRRSWLASLQALWSHAHWPSNLGGAFNMDMLCRAPGAKHTPEGPLGLCLTNLPGQAILIPTEVEQKLGKWNEEYGLYGGEDGDYGLRMNYGRMPQYYYHGPDYFENLPTNDDQTTYTDRGIDKRRLHRELAITDTMQPGKMLVNKFLYSQGIRPLKVMRRYSVEDVDSAGNVHVVERREYREQRRELAGLTSALNRQFRDWVMSFKPDHTVCDKMMHIYNKNTGR